MKIAPGIHRVESGNEVVYAVNCGRCYALVDVGSGPLLAEKLDQLKRDRVNPGQIEALFVTHNHPDHVGALAAARSQLRAAVVAHRLLVTALESAPMAAPVAADLVDHLAEDGDRVEVGRLVFEAHHLPGHTADSVAWQVGDALFVGDIIFRDGGIGWMDVHWGSCVADYEQSLERLRSFRGLTIYPGHGGFAPLTNDTIEQALTNLGQLANASGSPLAALGRPAPRASRPPGQPGRVISLPNAER